MTLTPRGVRKHPRGGCSGGSEYYQTPAQERLDRRPAERCKALRTPEGHHLRALGLRSMEEAIAPLGTSQFGRIQIGPDVVPPTGHGRGPRRVLPREGSS